MILFLIMGVQTLFFAGYAIFAKHGILTMRELRATNKQLQRDIASIEEKRDMLKADIADFKTYPFYQEQCAREQLQLGRPDDEIYFM